MNDIDLEGIEWTAIGSSEKPFVAELDGQGYSINNLTITEEKEYNSLFGHINNATIKNLNFSNANIAIDFESSGKSSIIATFSTNSTIKSCSIRHSTVSTSASYSVYTAGFVVNTNKTTIENCYILGGKISSLSYLAGSHTTQSAGIVSNLSSDSIIKNSYSIKYENSIYYLTQNNKNKTAVITDFLKTQTFDYNKFVHSIQKYSTQELQIPLLPLAAYFKVKMKKNDFSEILNLAHSYIVEYNNKI